MDNEKRSFWRKHGRKITVILAGLIVVLTAAGALGYFYLYKKPRQVVSIDPNSGELLVKNETSPRLDDRINILLIAADQRGNSKTYNTDSLILATIDPKSKRIGMLSIPRDTRVSIPKHGLDKINAAAAYGGLNMSVAVVQELTGVRIDGYIETNFNGFKSIIDTLGGIAVNVEKDMYYETGDAEDGYINLKKGEQLLDGSKALQYARFRHDTYGDITRTARQQVVLTAIAKKIMGPGGVLKIPALIPQFYRAVETNLPLSDLADIAKVIANYDSANIISQTLPGYFLDIDEISYWGVKEEDVKKVVAELFDGVAAGNTPDKLIKGSLSAGTSKSEPDKPPEDPKPEITMGVIGFSKTTATSVSVMVTASKGVAKAEIWRESGSTDPAKKGSFLVYPKNGLTWTGSAVSFTDSGLEPETSYAYSLKIYDAAGKLLSSSNPVSVVTEAQADLTQPLLSINSPDTDSLSTKTSVITVKGKTEPGCTVQIETLDKDKKVVKVWNATVDAAGSFSEPVSLTEGLNIINIKSLNSAGKYTIKTLSVTLDNIPPALTLSPPPAQVQTPQITLSGSVEPGAKLTVKTEWGTKVAFSETKPDTSGNFAVLLILDPGLTKVTLTAVDAVGNVTTKAVQINYTPSTGSGG